MQYNALSYQVTSARLTPFERALEITYRETATGMTMPPARVGVVPFERYLKSLHDVDCPSLKEWILHSPAKDLHYRLAQYMEAMQWEAEEAKRALSYRDNISDL